MAKQTFTTGQVLTAAQVNALNSNDFNQTVSVKTAAYTLVVGDRGTRVEFNTSGSVTCTVNSGIFDAGDTLVIQNRGAGVVTVTAGTATVNTSATLALSQYDGGTLYFISASAAIFFNTDAGGGSPLTTKGDLYGFSSLDARIPIGANDTVLTADSTESLGLKWAAVSAATPVYSNIASGSITSGTTLTLSGLTSFDNIRLTLGSLNTTNTGSGIQIRFNGTSSSNYQSNVATLYINNTGSTFTACTVQSAGTSITDNRILTDGFLAPGFSNGIFLNLFGCKSSSGFIVGEMVAFFESSVAVGEKMQYANVGLCSNAALSSIEISWEDGYAFTGGNYRLLGA